MSALVSETGLYEQKRTLPSRSITSKARKVMRKVLMEHQNAQCFYCGCALKGPKSDDPDKAFATLDHVRPYSIVKETVLDNLVLACVKCNVRKDSSSFEDFCALIVQEFPHMIGHAQRFSTRDHEILKEKANMYKAQAHAAYNMQRDINAASDSIVLMSACAAYDAVLAC